MLPWSGEFFWIPKKLTPEGYKSLYYQGGFNPEHADKPREFNAPLKSFEEHALLEKIIRFDFSLTEWSDHEATMPLYVGVHLVKFSVAGYGESAYASPNHLHQDGEKYTFGHLISRQGIEGGENCISYPRNVGKLPSEINQDDIHAHFTLNDPLESYGVNDPLVSHYVGKIYASPGENQGNRSILLIDFCSTNKNI